VNAASKQTLNNRFIAALPVDVAQKLSRHFEIVPLQRGAIIGRSGASVDELYFPDSGMISLIKPMSDGRTAEVGYVGIEGMSGVAALLDMKQSAVDRIVQMEGNARRIKTSLFREEMDRAPSLRQLVLRYMSYAIDQLVQTAACNRLHSLRQRCCRWLLTAHDNENKPTFALTHEFLALEMGVNRTSLSLAVGSLQKRGLIRYRRASVTILDRRGLESGSCECYDTLRKMGERIYPT